MLSFNVVPKLTSHTHRSFSFILPAAYFLAKGQVGRNVRWKLLAIAGGIGFQGFLGWYMVKSGLSEEILNTPGAVPRVSQYRLAMHLGAALLLYTGMVHTAFGVMRDWKFAHGEGKAAGVEVKNLMSVLNDPKVKKFGRWASVVGGLVLLTAVSGKRIIFADGTCFPVLTQLLSRQVHLLRDSMRV
jgi:cytochrome c oxidase assembly protein subunit 15